MRRSDEGVLVRCQKYMLAARLAAAQEQPAVAEQPLLPLDVVRDFLEDHDLVLAMRIDVKDVHAAVVALHARSTEAAAEPPAAEPAATEPSDDLALALRDAEELMAQSRGGATDGSCPNCEGGYARLDARNGCLVCDGCGAVLTLRSVNVEPEYVAPASAPRRGARGLTGVPQWMLQKSAAYVIADPEQRRSDHWDDLEHWNHYACLPHDELRRADHALRSWSDVSVSWNARIAAVLLYPHLRGKFPSTGDVRRRLRRQAALDVVVDPTPAPRFACEGCGDLRHTRRDAQMHCRMVARWGVKRKR